jgi:hypothetical protein
LVWATIRSTGTRQLSSVAEANSMSCRSGGIAGDMKRTLYPTLSLGAVGVHRQDRKIVDHPERDRSRWTATFSQTPNTSRRSSCSPPNQAATTKESSAWLSKRGVAKDGEAHHPAQESHVQRGYFDTPAPIPVLCQSPPGIPVNLHCNSTRDRGAERRPAHLVQPRPEWRPGFRPCDVS